MILTIADDCIDRALAAAQPGDTVIIKGNCTTRGAWAFPGFVSVKNNVRIEAVGATIKLANPVTFTDGRQRPDKDLPILRCNEQTEIIGGTWDCNYTGLPGWYCQGMRFFGRFTVRDASIRGMSGSRNSNTMSRQVESFAISAEGDISGSCVTKVNVSDCKSDTQDDYVSGIYMGGTQPSSLICRVSQCNVDLGKFGQFAYASNAPTQFEACYGTAQRFWYNDTGDTRSASLISCRGTATYAAISTVATTDVMREVWAHDCDFNAPRLVEWWDQTPTQDKLKGFVTLSMCSFDGDYYAAISAQRGIVSLLGCSIPHAAKVSVGPGAQPQIVRIA